MLSFWLCLWKSCFFPVCPCCFTHTHRQEMFDQLLQISGLLMMCNFCALGACRQRARFGFIPGLTTNPFMPCWPRAMVKPESGGRRPPRPGRAARREVAAFPRLAEPRRVPPAGKARLSAEHKQFLSLLLFLSKPAFGISYFPFTIYSYF